MAWSWSHSNEAYENALENLQQKSREWLCECLAEWDAAINSKGDFAADEFHANVFVTRQNYYMANNIANDSLVDAIWEKMEAQAICDNGGFNAWACPYGCHLISFDKGEQHED